MMRVISTAVAAAGLMALAACNPATPENKAAANALEEQADTTEAMADNATTEAGEQALENKADNLEEKADDLGGGDATPNSTNASNAGNAM